MSFKYNKLWDILNDRNITKTDLRILIGVSQTTIANMGKNNNVHLDVIDKICDCLHCTPNEIIDYYENEESIDLSAGGTLECTGEYKLEWVGSKKQ